jgi:hypothetical protein
MIIYGRMTYTSCDGEFGTFDRISVQPVIYETEYPIWIPDKKDFTYYNPQRLSSKEYIPFG